ncbi:superoxide dismutase family protein [Estrella lausannensis]|uniref:Copper/zinc superoxide dismutase n=1 Tax=Estrella lausannensis TaxID=483423 RepID=A0A0H5E4N9_9BACT|nr:superoxide dismutase family protein [Estrella lausannensis]CRX38200.1 Copper/zinc superoxide dismutase [Estrella lausannensis]
MIQPAKKRLALTALSMAIATFSLLTGCSEECECPDFKKAKALLEPIDGSNVKGVVTFIEEKRGVKIIADFTGLTPGEHGLIIHESNACSGPGAMDAGRHFNPSKAPHAGPNDSPRHAGDLGNVKADSKGKAHLERLDFVIRLDGPESILGKAIVVHKYRDDYISQPVGNTGAGLACGLIFPTESVPK